MNLKMDAKPDDDPGTEESAATDTPADEETDDPDEFAHLDSLSDGAGCAEVWEHLSETRGDG